MAKNSILLLLVLRSILLGQTLQFCPQLSTDLKLSVWNPSRSHCYTVGKCYLTLNTTDDHRYIVHLQGKNDSSSLDFPLSKLDFLINHNRPHGQILFSFQSPNGTVHETTSLSTKGCFHKKEPIKRNLLQQDRRTGSTTPSIVITFNSSSFIDYHHRDKLHYPLHLSVRFRTLGRISNGVLLSVTRRKNTSTIFPFVILEHTNGRIEITFLKLDERNALSTVTTGHCGKNVNNDSWHWLQFEIDHNGMFTLVVDDDSWTSQIPSYVVSSWNINALFVGHTGRLSTDIFQPFLGYMSELVFDGEHLFTSLSTRKEDIKSSFHHSSQHVIVGYRIAFFNLVTIDTPTSYIAFSERESQNKNHGKLDIYFLFRSFVPDGIILYRYAQGLNEYFAIGLRAGILALSIDFGYGKRQILSDESTKLADGKWHEVRVTRIGTDKIELVVDNRYNRSTLSANGIRNAVSLQPVLYVGGIPTNNHINLAGSGLTSSGFQGCLSSFIVDGRLLHYPRALALQGKVKMNVCSDLNKFCYDFTCLHSGVCTSNENEGPRCQCTETAYTGERCDKLSVGFYFGQNHSIGSLEYVISQPRQTEHDTITLGLQTLSTSVQIFRLESDNNLRSLEYEIVRGRSYIKFNLGEKQPDVYSASPHLTDGMYHTIKIVRKHFLIELYVDGVRVELKGGNKSARLSDAKAFLPQRRLKIGSFKNGSHWNGILAGLSLNHQPIFDSLRTVLIRAGDVEEVSPDQYINQFHLINTSYIHTSTVTTSTFLSIETEKTSMEEVSNNSSIDHLSEKSVITKISIVPPLSTHHRSVFFRWVVKQVTRFSTRGIIIGSIIACCFLLFLLFIIIRLRCTRRPRKRKTLTCKYNQSNGKTYSQLNRQSQRYSVAAHNGRASKKRVPNLLRYLHTNEAKPSSFRLSSNGGDSYHLISSMQDKPSLPYRNSDCVLNEHCCIHSSASQPTTSSSPSIYHQINRLMLSGSDPPLPLPNLTQSHPATLRSLKKELDNSSAQTYSAVYSCELAANLDVDQQVVNKRLSTKRRSILKNTHSLLVQTKILFLYAKNPVGCYALQPSNRPNNEPILLAIADENRIQLNHALTGSFHSQLPVSSVGSCHDILFSYNGQYLIGLFYEVTSNINPYGVKIWSTEDYSIRMNSHPIKCSIAVTSRYSSLLYMAGKQKYGRGISLGLLDIDSCSLARELKSDPDTSIGDEIRRIILTRNESYALVACTEHTSTYTCFVVFKLETLSNLNNMPESMSNCTMILTRFDSDPHHTFSINVSNNHGEEQMLTVLRTNEILVWKLEDGEILFKYDFHHLNSEKKIQNCQMNENRLLILLEQGLVHIWDVTLVTGQFSLIATISDASIYSISWLDQRHFLSIDQDGQRIRTWNIHRADVLNEFISFQGTLQTLHVHSITNDSNKRQEYLITGKSINERNLLIFEYTQPCDEPGDSSNVAVC